LFSFVICIIKGGDGVRGKRDKGKEKDREAQVVRHMDRHAHARTHRGRE
jgi:hypothetical protein